MHEDGGHDQLAQSTNESHSSNNLQTLEYNSLNPSQTCPNCAAAAVRAATDAERIQDLELQLQSLSLKASRVADQLADYEDQLQQLASGDAKTNSLNSLQSSPRPSFSGSLPSVLPAQPSTLIAEKRSNIGSRFQNFLSRRGANSVQPTVSVTPPTTIAQTAAPPSQDDLPALLEKERQARVAAETALTTVQAELEDLSVTLFSEANEMVAGERRLRAKDAERARALEEQATTWHNQAQQFYTKWKETEEEAQRQADRLKEIEQNVSFPESRTQQAIERDEQRWKRVQALERAVNRLSVAKSLVNGTPPPYESSAGDE